MNKTALNLIAIAVFGMTFFCLLTPILDISPTIPALITVAFLGLITIDTLSFQNQGATLFLDLFNSQEQKQRIIHHEAGHFLAAYCLGLPIAGYTLSAWQAWKQGQGGSGGVIIDQTKIRELLQNPQAIALIVDRLCIVWMAGMAAEKLIYGDIEGGESDRAQLKSTLSLLGVSPDNYAQKQRWGQIQAYNLIINHRAEYDALVQAMSEGKSVTDCYQNLARNDNYSLKIQLESNSDLQ